MDYWWINNWNEIRYGLFGIIGFLILLAILFDLRGYVLAFLFCIYEAAKALIPLFIIFLITRLPMLTIYWNMLGWVVILVSVAVAVYIFGKKFLRLIGVIS